MWSFLSYSPETVWFRTALAFLVSLGLSLAFGGSLINYLKSISKSGQPIRSDGPKSHIKEKKGTPTMGGLIILVSIIIPMKDKASLELVFEEA